MPEMDSAQKQSFEGIVQSILDKSQTEGDAKTIADEIIKIAKSRASKTSFGSFCYIDPAEIEEMVINNAELSLKRAEEERIAKEKADTERKTREAAAEAAKKEKEELKKKEALEKKLEKERKTAEGEQMTLDLFGGGM